MLLERWTGITVVFSRPHVAGILPDGSFDPTWAAIFKGKDGSRCNVTSPHRRCKVLYAPTGSVNTETWLAYLDFILPRVDNPRDAVVTTTDWYAPHLAEEAKDFARPRTKSPTLMIGGGTSGEVAVCNKTPHRVLALRYKELEMCAHTRPNKIPRWTKQQVLERGWEAWQDLKHDCGFKLHKSHGYTTKVDGTEDGGFDSSVVHFWQKLGMKEVRQKIATQVRLLVDQGVYTDWDEASYLMEPHDNHRLSYEGDENDVDENSRLPGKQSQRSCINAVIQVSPSEMARRSMISRPTACLFVSFSWT